MFELPELFREKVDPQFDILSAEIAEPLVVPIPLNVLTPEWRAFCEAARVQPYMIVMYRNFTGSGKVWAVDGIFKYGLSRNDAGNAAEQMDSSSGNFGDATVKYIKRALARNSLYQIKRSTVVVSRSLPEGKKARMRAAGAEVIEVDGGSVDAIKSAEANARLHHAWYTRQYQNADNGRGFLIPAQTIARELPQLGILAVGVGSAGTCTGVMTYLTAAFGEERINRFRRVGVIVENGEKVGGVTDERALHSRTQPWQTVIDEVRIVGEDKSYRLSSALWRMGDDTVESDAYPVGPSTGFALEGALLAARNLHLLKRLDEYRALDGMVHVAAPAMDMRMPYRTEYEGKGIFLGDRCWEEPVFD